MLMTHGSPLTTFMLRYMLNQKLSVLWVASCLALYISNVAAIEQLVI